MPSRDDLAYLNVHTVEDSVKYGHLRLRNIPITHNKSPTRWRNVRTWRLPVFISSVCACGVLSKP